MKTIAGLFDNYQDAEHAVNRLEKAGIAREHIGVLARDAVLNERVLGHEEESAAKGAGIGAVGGTAVGGLAGLLSGLSAITIPGLGPVLTAGAVITALGSTAAGAGIGAATGGIIGALTGAGIPEEDAHVYAESVRQGGILLTVKVNDDMATPVRDIMDQSHAVDINERRNELLESGWLSFDETTMPEPGEMRYSGARSPQ
jgi:uncharacterized membrane protein